MWWTDQSHANDSCVGVTVVTINGNERSSRRRSLHTWHIEVFEDELLAIRFLHAVQIRKSITIRRHGVNMSAAPNNLEAIIQWMANLGPGTGHQVV